MSWLSKRRTVVKKSAWQAPRRVPTGFSQGALEEIFISRTLTTAETYCVQTLASLAPTDKEGTLNLPAQKSREAQSSQVTCRAKRRNRDWFKSKMA